MSLLDGLVAWWDLDDANDAHTNNYDLTNDGSVPFVTGKVGNGADFEATAAEDRLRISIASAPGLSPGNNGFTIGTWVRWEGTTGTQWICANVSASSAEYWMGHEEGTGNTKFTCYGTTGFGTETPAARSGSLTNGTWYLVMGWFDPTTDKCYLQVTNDSSYESTVNESAANLTSGPFQANGSFAIGGDPAAGFARWLDGVVDSFGVWSRVLTAQERQDLWNGGSGRSYATLDSGGGGGGAYRVASRYRSVRR